MRSNGGGSPKPGGYNGVVAVLERHQDLVDELLAEVEAYKPDVDRELLTRAFDYAAQAHSGQLRQSGQEFIYHPWGVAKILAGLQLDEATLAAALLHDVVEDTSTDIEELRAEFGDEVANLVEGVTKLTRVKFQSREHAEAMRERRVDLERLACLLQLLLLAEVLDRAQVVQPVGELDQDHAQVLGHRDDQLPVVLRLCVLAALELDARQLGDTLDEIRDLVAEFPA